MSLNANIASSDRQVNGGSVYNFAKTFLRRCADEREKVDRRRSGTDRSHQQQSYKKLEREGFHDDGELECSCLPLASSKSMHVVRVMAMTVTPIGSSFQIFEMAVTTNL
jgi:hypothetical protein